MAGNSLGSTDGSLKKKQKKQPITNKHKTFKKKKHEVPLSKRLLHGEPNKYNKKSESEKAHERSGAQQL